MISTAVSDRPTVRSNGLSTFPRRRPSMHLSSVSARDKSMLIVVDVCELSSSPNLTSGDVRQDVFRQEFDVVEVVEIEYLEIDGLGTDAGEGLDASHHLVG